MRIALFSPLPPSRSGIADYTDALLEPLRGVAEVDTFTEAPASFDPAAYDACVYQLGNNPFHTFAYQAAMQHPGIIVLHEANLHHLIADLYIRRDNWPGYLKEVEFEGGAEALAYAKRYVEPLRRGPDYDLPMLRRILTRSKAVIVHSDAVGDVVRASGFTGPIAKIPHGAWVESEIDGAAYRAKLGLDPTTPLFGIFGFLKPYKRIAESLRAFRRVVAEHPEAKLILVGEAHAELPLARLIATLGLGGHVRHIDYAPIQDFNGYLAACDAVINLRYPTVGESSGTLLRALGLGKATLVSDIGSFREFPDDICLKVPAGPAHAATEEEHIFEYLRLLLNRPEIRKELGCRARRWVEQECSWQLCAERYAAFANDVATGVAKNIPEPPPIPPPPVEVSGEYIQSWVPEEGVGRDYVKTHETRLTKTLAITPPGGPEDRALEMGAYLQITPALKTKLGYGEVRGCYFGPLGRVDHRTVTSDDGTEFQCDIDLFDAEKDIFPYDDGSFATVLCCELVEHLPNDPMHMMCELNRILRPGGHLVMTTPNIASLRALAGILQGFHPMLFPAYLKPNQGGDVDPRHAREYTAPELKMLFEDSGFEVTLLETGPFLDEPRADFGWVQHLLEQYMLTQDYRGDGIYIVGRKTKPVRDRYPAWLYS